MKITNTQPGPRGVNTTTGAVLIDPKQTVDVKVYAREKEGMESSGWFEIKGDYEPNPDAPASHAGKGGDDVAGLKAKITDLEAQIVSKDAEIAALKAGDGSGEGNGAGDGKSGSTGSYAVSEKSAGWFVVTQDGKEVTKSLRKDAVDGFDALSDGDKAKFVEANKAD